MIQFDCIHCSRAISVVESAVGQRAKCPHCGRINKVEEPIVEATIVQEENVDSGFTGYPATPPSMSSKECPYCSEVIPANAKKCKSCGEIVDVILARELDKPQQTPKSSPGKGFAITSLVLGLVGLVLVAVITGTLAIIFGACAKSAMNRHSTKQYSGMATAGITLGIIDVIFGIIQIIFWTAFIGAFING